MSLFTPHKVNVLPVGSAIDPNGIYFLLVSGGFEIHIANSAGTALQPLGFLPLSGGVIDGQVRIARDDDGLNAALRIENLSNPVNHRNYINFNSLSGNIGRVATSPDGRLQLFKFDIGSLPSPVIDSFLSLDVGYVQVGPEARAQNQTIASDHDLVLPTKAYIEALINNRLAIAGGSLTGNLTLSNATANAQFTLNTTSEAGNPVIRLLRQGASEGSIFTIKDIGVYLRRAGTNGGPTTDLIVRDGHVQTPQIILTTPITSVTHAASAVTKKYVDDSIAAISTPPATTTPAPTPSYVMARSNAPTTQNIYSTAWQELPMVGAGFDVDNSDYEISGNGIKCLFDGWVEVCAQMHITSIGQRSALQMRLRNGTHTSLQIASTGYIRVTSGHNESSLRAVDHIQVSNGDVITAESQRESTNATAVFLKNVGGASMIIKRL